MQGVKGGYIQHLKGYTSKCFVVWNYIHVCYVGRPYRSCVVSVLGLNSMQEFQETALMVAARKGSVEIVKMLIRHGANTNLTNKVAGFVWWALILIM